jgi:PAS domain S-box-containing protein
MDGLKKPLRVAFVAGLILAYGLLAMRFGSCQAVTSPLAFGAVVLGVLWWERRGVLMAGAFAALSVVPHLGGADAADLWGGLARAVSLLIVAFGLAESKRLVVRARRVSERMYRDIMGKALTGIFVYRGEKVLYANSRFRAFLGYGDEDLTGLSLWKFFHEEERPAVRARLAERDQGIVSDLHYECRLVSKHGHPVWADVVSSVMEHEGEPAILVSVYDLTERKDVEEKRQELSLLALKQEEQLVHSTRLAEMGEMAASIGHELNQPLTGIKNYAKNAAYMIEEGAGDLSEVKGNLDLISSQVDRASRIIGQMRQLARRSERQFAPVEINQKLRETVEFVMPQLRLSGVEVSFHLAGDLPEVMGDSVRLEQVFLNLLTNARQAMEDMQERRLTIVSRHEAGAERPVVVEIADTGKGFPRETAEKLFTPFFSTKQARHGTGLGLSISLSIVKDHKGTIEAAGTEGRGARFTVRLPAVHQDGGANPQESVA